MQKRLQRLKEGARTCARGLVWSVLFVGLLASLAGTAVMVIAGVPVYVPLFLPSVLLTGAALQKWEAGTR